MNTDTPETDSAYTQRPNEGAWDFRIRQEKTMEKLERERDELKRWTSVNGVIDLQRERDEAREYADRLAEGLPEGMLPKDVEVLREANLGLATELAAVTEQQDYMTLRLGETQERMINAERQRDRLQKIVDEQCRVSSVCREYREQRDRLAEVIEQLKSQLTQTRGAVTICRNGYVQELEQQRDRLAEALRNIMAYRKGGKPYDYWRLPFEERENAAFDGWMQIENNINQALQSLTPNAEP
jgi:hypothetical protein